MSQPPLASHGLSVCFGRTVALDGLDLEVRAGEVTALVGPNGAGKTTTLRAAAGLVRPAAGTIRVFGHDPVREAVTARRLLGLLPDRPGLPPELTVAELLRLCAVLYRLRGREAEGALAAVAEELEIVHLLHRRSGALSHGQAQRVALAAVLLPRPPLLMVDEPMSALDLAAQAVVRRALSARARSGAAVLMTTHTVGHVAALADRVLRLEHGRITAECAGNRNVEALERWILDGSS